MSTGKNGCIVENMEELVSVINNTDIDELNRMGAVAKQTIIESHSLGTWLDRYIKSIG